MNEEPKLFTIIRHADESGVSGTGRVIDGAVFHNGWTFIVWRTEDKHGENTFGFYPTYDLFKKIHIDSHPKNRTEVIWSNSDFGIRKSGICPRCRKGYLNTKLITQADNEGKINEVSEKVWCQKCDFNDYKAIKET